LTYITAPACTSKTKPFGLNTIITAISVRAHDGGTHCVPPFIIGFHGRYVSHLDQHATHSVCFGAVAAMLSFVKELELAKQFFFHNVTNNQVQASC
jgi:hypothetical protein